MTFEQMTGTGGDQVRAAPPAPAAMDTSEGEDAGAASTARDANGDGASPRRVLRGCGALRCAPETKSSPLRSLCVCTIPAVRSNCHRSSHWASRVRARSLSSRMRSRSRLRVLRASAAAIATDLPGGRVEGTLSSAAPRPPSRVVARSSVGLLELGGVNDKMRSPQQGQQQQQQ